MWNRTGERGTKITLKMNLCEQIEWLARMVCMAHGAIPLIHCVCVKLFFSEHSGGTTSHTVLLFGSVESFS